VKFERSVAQFNWNKTFTTIEWHEIVVYIDKKNNLWYNVRMGQKTVLVAGLGNLGDKYQDTYHNMGFWVVDLLCQKWGVTLDKKECDSLTGFAMVEGVRVVLAKPTTFMNNSGLALKALLKKYKLQPSDCMVVYDDIDLPCGGVRLRKEGSAGTHNGMRSVVNETGHTDIARVRIGVGRPPESIPLINFVLMKVLGEHFEPLQKACQEASQQIAKWCVEPRESK